MRNFERKKIYVAVIEIDLTIPVGKSVGMVVGVNVGLNVGMNVGSCVSSSGFLIYIIVVDEVAPLTPFASLLPDLPPRLAPTPHEGG